ncbi:unnamed protein product [Rotaria sp. Silwood1]|nr:unnamed protein product [Rotaria sp. Silwood1]CAF0838538.1 unnamed protein product [Rotaria sp. Silwood1]CAF3363566.1 unnamed protein product [Rotaria sp. Silwood1]CAF4980505.1 unnamed protein product [Rotaria sp. Silwood1]
MRRIGDDLGRIIHIMIVVHIEHKVIGLSASDFYYFLDALHTQKKKIQTSSIKLQTERQKINTIYQYFTDLSSSSPSSSSKKSSSSSVNTTNKKQTNSSVTTNEEGTINSPSSKKDQQYPRYITKIENFFDSKVD